MSKFLELTDQFKVAVEALNGILLGGASSLVTLPDGSKAGSIEKQIADSFKSLQSMVSGRLSYKTLAALNLDLAHAEDTVAEVWNDPINENNGLYGKFGAAGAGYWGKSPYDAIKIVQSLSDDLVSTLDNRIGDKIVPTDDVFYMVDSKGYILFKVDSDANFVTSSLKTDLAKIGSLEPEGISFKDADFKNRGSFDFEYAVADSSGNVVLGIKSDGRIYSNGIETQSSLLPEVAGFECVISDQSGKVAAGVSVDGGIYLHTLKVENLDVDCQWRSLNVSNCDGVMIVGDSHTASHYTLKDKSYISNLSALCDYRFYNYGVSGNDALQMNRRVISDTEYFDGLSPSSMAAGYAFILSHDNDGTYLAGGLDSWKENLERLIDSVAATGALPVLVSEFKSTADQLMIMKKITDERGLGFVDNATLNYQLSGLDKGPFFQGHPGTRTNAVLWTGMLDYIKSLPQPQQSIKIFRSRNSAETDLSKLLYKGVVDRNKKFKELTVSHQYLATESEGHYDELDGDDVYSFSEAIDEYALLAKGGGVQFSNHLLIDVVLPGTAKSIDALRVFLPCSDNGADIYVRDWHSESTAPLGNKEGGGFGTEDYIAKTGQPFGAWKLIGSSQDEHLISKLNGLLNYDRITFLVVSSVSNTLTNCVIRWAGKGGKQQIKKLGASSYSAKQSLFAFELNAAGRAEFSFSTVPRVLIPIDVNNAPLGISSSPVTEVVQLIDGQSLTKTIQVPSQPGQYRLIVWARTYPKAFLNNGLYGLDPDQVIDTASATYPTDSEITPDSFDLSTLQLRTSHGTEIALDGVLTEEYVCLGWRPVEYLVNVPSSLLSGLDLTLSLSVQGSDIQIAKIELEEI